MGKAHSCVCRRLCFCYHRMRTLVSNRAFTQRPRVHARKCTLFAQGDEEQGGLGYSTKVVWNKKRPGDKGVTRACYIWTCMHKRMHKRMRVQHTRGAIDVCSATWSTPLRSRQKTSAHGIHGFNGTRDYAHRHGTSGTKY
jgi:hypothetical protein